MAQCSLSSPRRHDKDQEYWRRDLDRAGTAAPNSGFGNTGGSILICIELGLFRASFPDQSTKRLEGAEWSRCVHRRQIVRGISPHDDAERARRIAA